MQKKSRPVVFRHKVGLALSGGGTRGVAHIGVLQAFAENNVKFDCVAGTSAGSILGALYCAGIPCDEILQAAKTLTKKDLINKRFALGSNPSNIEQAALRILGDITFDQLKIPFAAVAVDIQTGAEVVLNSGSVCKAIAASSAVPMLYKPLEMDGMRLVDGGLLNNMPADVCRKMGAEVVISVDLNHNRGRGTTSNKLLDTVIATWTITTKSTMYKGQINSDFVIAPELSEYKNTKLSGIDEMVREGYRAAVDSMEEIKQLLQTKF
ncbi:MAG: patatin-like phospholipase family protein [Corallococcus sp.]|nr:patatin-like phospholipase family protein [Corallococcus sp.]MCM1360051.1 patatin-like phospholipase family protein [Corallococcus sp.]MCM1395608.1 patatin-like phospholipase family protein [Corallococcus sp.]